MQQRLLLRNILILLLSLVSIPATAQQEANDKASNVSDSLITNTEKKTKKNLFQKIYSYFEESNQVKPDKKFDISFIGGPSYSGDTKFGIGLVASGLYRIDRSDKSIAPSNVSLYTNITTSGFIAVGVDGNTIFPHDNYRINYDMYYSLMPSKYWGIGYDKGRPKKGYTKYRKHEFNFKVDGLKKITDNIFFGVTLTAKNVEGKKFDDWSYLGYQNRSNRAIGGGIIASYDSRDFIPNAYRGLYIKLEQNFYPKFMGSNHDFRKFDFTTRYYQQVWKGGILAFDFNAVLNSGNVPWSMLAEIGGSRQMRGYFIGQYRDKKMVNTQIELRQRIYKRHGAVVWAGAGNAFSNLNKYKWSHTLPTFGLGYRWEFKNRINVRLDYGIGKGQNGFYFNINESF